MSTIKANDLTNTTGGIPTVKSQQLIPTAWVNFNGTGTVAIRDSENVSSITDLGTGYYQVTFTTTMPNTNYSPTMSTNGGVIRQINATTAFVSIQSVYPSNLSNGYTPIDVAAVNVHILGGQS